jgi:fructose-1,6-bisphosphatase/inositol monophosphatase family enzyme
MASDKMKSEDTVPQADKQAQTEIAQREGTEGAQAHVINKEESQKKKGY